MAKHDDKTITARRVSDWFKASFKTAPWPDQAACKIVAAKLESLRTATAGRPSHSTSSKTNPARRAALDLLAALPERRRYWASAKPSRSVGGRGGEDTALPGTKLTTDAERAISALEDALEDAERATCTLETALKNAMPYLDFPPMAAALHRRRPEHAVIFHIARVAAEALHSSGRTRLGTDRTAPLVEFIVHALEGIDHTPPPYATVATVLSRIPAIEWVKQQMLMPPQTKIEF